MHKAYLTPIYDCEDRVEKGLQKLTPTANQELRLRSRRPVTIEWTTPTSATGDHAWLPSHETQLRDRHQPEGDGRTEAEEEGRRIEPDDERLGSGHEGHVAHGPAGQLQDTRIPNHHTSTPPNIQARISNEVCDESRKIEVEGALQAPLDIKSSHTLSPPPGLPKTPSLNFNFVSTFETT